jgi:hypothetical protein
MRTSFELKFAVENLEEAKEQTSMALERFLGYPDMTDVWSKVDVEFRVGFGDVKTIAEIEAANLAETFVVTAHVVLKNTLLHPGIL